jgi:cytochrome c peroxidase
MRSWIIGLTAAATLSACRPESAAPPKPAEPPASATAVKTSTAPSKPSAMAPAKLRELARGVFGTYPTAASLTPTDDPTFAAKVALGRQLYFDTRLSKNHDLSCATCHDLQRFGVDARERDGQRTPTSMGHKGQLGGRNSPTSYNAVLHVAQFWDGRAADLSAQAKGPMLNPVEMAMPGDNVVVTTLRSIPGYSKAFKTAFPQDKDPITYQNTADAIAAFEKLLLTPSRFDEFLAGKDEALTANEQRGLQRFVEVGCMACHLGPALGGGMFQKLGLIKPYETKDLGRYELTKQDSDRYFFKVPSLRNIEQTGPYFHDGSIARLEQAVILMAEHQTASGPLDAEDVGYLVAFLKSLTGTPDAAYIQAPELPKSGPKTPKPDPS